MSRRIQEFQTLRSEGGLLPSDLLRRVIDTRGSLKGTRPEDYGLPQGERLNEVITQSWNRLRRHWGEFRATAAKLPEGEAGTGLTNDKWSLPLLRELGFGLLPTSASPELAGRTYAISRFFGSVPIHLVGCGLSLDRRAAGVRGAAGGNPHGLVQEVLNRSPDHLWGIVGNGLRLRILRDNQALSRQSFLEFDLEAMFAAEAYSDFVLLWLVAHATRFAPRDGNRIESCWLEEWTKEAQEQGTRALKDLRGSVERALQVLGEGFTSHPKNTALREALRSGTLPLADFHGQLLRVVYRLIFLFVAEDRTLEGQPLLHPRNDSEAARVARERYAAHYGTARLRDLAGKIKGSRHGDLWRQFQILVGALSGEPAFEGTRRTLALPALGSFLWSPGSTANLSGAELTNHDFLEALRHLAFTRQGKVLRPVDYRNLGAEELGGVYESLLALTPQISADGARFTFAEFAGNERKTSGSYYTPDSLVQCLLDSALDPVVEEAIKGKAGAEAEQAILCLKVCDPAVGSGHFLVGAAHRLARHLARVRAQALGESEPSPLLYQHALRDVIGRCLYGVDLNPMAAELCRVSLWLEALEPGKPLSFLDYHIQVGNSLLGTTPVLISSGLPDAAFDPIEGDDKKVCATLKKRNRQERDGGQTNLDLQMVAEPCAEYDTLASQSQSIDQTTDESIEAIKRKAEHFQSLILSREYQHRKQVADAWCAAFVWTKSTAVATEPITTDTIRRLEVDGQALSPAQRAELERLARHFQFFHWHLAFPHVFANGGFDCILGNPPWEKLTVLEQEFFAGIPEVASEQRANRRKAAIVRLQNTNPELFSRWTQQLRDANAAQALVSRTRRFPLTAVGELNLFPLFSELAFQIVSPTGEVGLIVKSSLLLSPTWSDFTATLVDCQALRAALDFRNWKGWFPEIGYHERFTLLHFGRSASTDCRVQLGFYFDYPEDVKTQKAFYLTSKDLAFLNPLTKTLPVFESQESKVLLTRLYRQFYVLATSAGGWDLAYTTGFHMSGDAELLATKEELLDSGFGQGRSATLVSSSGVYLPLIEGKLLHQFDPRFATFAGIPKENRFGRKAPTNNPTDSQKADPNFCIEPRYWIDSLAASQNMERRRVDVRGALTFRDTTNVISNFRTAVGCIAAGWAFNYKAPNLVPGASVSAPAPWLLNFCALFNSFPFDYVVRQKFFGANLIKSIIDQLACPRPLDLQGIRAAVEVAALELTYTTWDLESFAKECGWDGPPFRWAEERRFQIRCELDAAFFCVYLQANADGQWRQARKADGCPQDETVEELAELQRYFPTPRDAIAYIMDTFPILRRRDEEEYNGDYRTKRVILEIYDAMREAIRTGQPYRTRLDPPPGPPRDADGKFIPYAQIADNPPPHIHLPRGVVAGGGVTLQLSDLATRFPTEPFLLRLSTRGDAKAQRVRPVRTADIQAANRIVLASAKLRNAGTPVPAVVGKMRAEARTDASDGSAYVLVTVRGKDGTAQARFSEGEWRNLTTIGVVEDSAGS